MTVLDPGFLFIFVGTVIWQVPDARCQDPCLSAVNIGDYRRSTNYVLSADDPLLCDANLDESKFRTHYYSCRKRREYEECEEERYEAELQMRACAYACSHCSAFA